MSETTLPALAISNPLCAVCLEETDSDGYGWDCNDCGIHWDEDGSDAEWLYPDDGQCPSTYTRKRGGLSVETETFRCMRMASHDVALTHEHSDLLSGWKTGGPGVGEVASGE